MDQRAQISAEYILLVAIILLIVVVFAVVITDQNEQNSVATTAQLGASNASASLVLSNNTLSPIKVTSVNMVDTSSTGITITIKFNTNVASQKTAIFNSIEKSLRAAGYNNLTNTGSNITLTTNTQIGLRHNYLILLGS